MTITAITLITAGAGAEAPSSGVRAIDLAAFVGLAFVWIFVFALLVGIYRVLRSKARGDAGWGDSPGL